MSSSPSPGPPPPRPAKPVIEQQTIQSAADIQGAIADCVRTRVAPLVELNGRLSAQNGSLAANNAALQKQLNDCVQAAGPLQQNAAKAGALQQQVADLQQRLGPLQQQVDRLSADNQRLSTDLKAKNAAPPPPPPPPPPPAPVAAPAPRAVDVGQIQNLQSQLAALNAATAAREAELREERGRSAGMQKSLACAQEETAKLRKALEAVLQIPQRNCTSGSGVVTRVLANGLGNARSIAGVGSMGAIPTAGPNPAIIMRGGRPGSPTAVPVQNAAGRASRPVSAHTLRGQGGSAFGRGGGGSGAPAGVILYRPVGMRPFRPSVRAAGAGAFYSPYIVASAEPENTGSATAGYEAPSVDAYALAPIHIPVRMPGPA
jgi:hypothetical protein